MSRTPALSSPRKRGSSFFFRRGEGRQLDSRFRGNDKRWIVTALALALAACSSPTPQQSYETGVTPLSYQPAYRDPTGQTIELEFRKAF